MPITALSQDQVFYLIQLYNNSARYGVPKDFPTLSEMDVFGRTIHEMFYSVTTRGINHITLNQFDEICQSKKYNIDLTAEEKNKLVKTIVK